MDHFRVHVPPQMGAMPPQPSQGGDGMLHLPSDMLPPPPQQQQHQPDAMSSAMLRGMPPSAMSSAYSHPTSNPNMMSNQPGVQMGSSMNPMASGSHGGTLNMHQLTQLNAQIRAYKILTRNQPLNEMLMCAVQGKRIPTQLPMSGGAAPMTAGPPMTMTAGPPQPNFSGMSTNPPSSVMLSQPQRVASSTALNSPGGSSAGVSSQVNSPAASLQPQPQTGVESPSTPVTSTMVPSVSQQQSSTIHSELKAMNNSMAPNVSITSSNSPLPISAPPTNTMPTISIPASTSNSTDGSGSQDNSQDSTTTVSSSQQQQQMISKQLAPPVKQVKITPYSKPAGIDPVMLLKEREIRYVCVLVCLFVCPCGMCVCMLLHVCHVTQ